MSCYQQHDLAGRGRREAASSARFPLGGWRERERVMEISSWSEMGGEEPARRRDRRETARELRARIDRHSSPPLGLMILIASTLLIVGLLFQAAMGTPR